MDKPRVGTKLSLEPRPLVIMTLWASEKLDDRILSNERMQIFNSKPFKDWPKDMQDDLAPYGAAMIVTGDERSVETTSPGPFEQKIPRDKISAQRYSEQEWNLMISIPWSRLPQELKDKTICYKDDPISQQMDPDRPICGPLAFP